MITAKTGTRISLKNILFLTDFSDSSKAALPFALAMGQPFGAKIHALHVLLPEPTVYTMPEMTVEALKAEEDFARAEMQKLETRLGETPHHTYVVRDVSVRDALLQVAAEIHADLIVMGSEGRTGPKKMLFGSVAEDIFRHSTIPVLTIGPKVRPGENKGHFSCILYATDLTEESFAALPYAVSLAEENQSRLVLLNVVSGRQHSPDNPSMISAFEKVRQLIPPDADLWCTPETVLKNGDTPVSILEVASQVSAGLIVLGARSPDFFGVATHLGGAVAHEVLAHAGCPILTVRR